MAHELESPAMTDALSDDAPSGARSRSLLVNYLSLLGGTLVSKGFSLLTVLMLTRYLGVEDFGRYSLVFSYWALLNILVDGGVTQILGRELARDPAASRKLIESAVYLRLSGCLIFLPGGFWLARWLGLGQDLAFVAFAGLFAGFEALYDIFFSATMQLDKNAKARYFSSIGNVILMALAVILGLPLLAVAALGLLNPLLKLVYDYRLSPFKPRLHAPDWSLICRFALDGWPLWLAGIQYVLLARIDTFLLQKLSPTGEHDLGLYAAAFRFSEVMALLINALCPAMLPLLVRHMHDAGRIRFLAGTGTRLILTVLMLMSLFVFWYAPWIVRVYGNGYEEAAACMRILIWSQVLVALNTLCYQLLVIYNVQGRRTVMLSGVLMTLLNIGLNIWLIPSMHARGASWATVITELAIALSMLWFLRRHTPLRLGRDILLMEILALAACVPVLLLGEGFGWLSLVVFMVLVWALRLVTPEAIRQLAQEKLHADPPNPRSADTNHP